MAGPLIRVAVPEITEVLDDWTSLRLYRASSRAGSYSVITTWTLAAATTAYTYEDTAGSATSWYKTAYYHTGTLAESELSEAFPALEAPLLTRQTLRQQVADMLGLYGRPAGSHTFPGASGTTTGAGTSTTVVCSDYNDSLYPTTKFKGWFLHLTSGDRVNEERRVSGLSSGTFTVSRAYTGAPGSSVTFELYGELTAVEWSQSINEALLHIWTPFNYPLAGIANQTQYVLPAYIEGREQIMRLVRVTGSTIREHRLTAGQEFLVTPSEGGGCTLYLPSGIGAQSIYELQGFRHPAPLDTDAQTIALSEQMADILKIGAACRSAKRLSERGGLALADREHWRARMDALEAERQARMREVGFWQTTRTGRGTSLVSSGGSLW